jgi:hypothetical protein
MVLSAFFSSADFLEIYGDLDPSRLRNFKRLYLRWLEFCGGASTVYKLNIEG